MARLQVPPAFSAVKVGGTKGYEAARAGKPLDIPARPRQVHEFAVWRDTPGTQDVSYRIRCGKGTYVRSLVHDLVRHPLPLQLSAWRNMCLVCACLFWACAYRPGVPVRMPPSVGKRHPWEAMPHACAPPKLAYC